MKMSMVLLLTQTPGHIIKVDFILSCADLSRLNEYEDLLDLCAQHEVRGDLKK